MSSVWKSAHKCLSDQGPLGSIFTALLSALVTRMAMDLYEAMMKKRIAQDRKLDEQPLAQ